MDGGRTEAMLPPPSNPNARHALNHEERNNPEMEPSAFKSPSAGTLMNLNGIRNSPDLALITPEKKFISSENNQVRKRPLPISPSEESGSEMNVAATKKKSVAKVLFQPGSSVVALTSEALKSALFGNGSGGGGGCASKCLFGPPSAEENQKIAQQVDNNNKKVFEAFEKRYVVEEILDVNY